MGKGTVWDFAFAARVFMLTVLCGTAGLSPECVFAATSPVDRASALLEEAEGLFTKGKLRDALRKAEQAHSLHLEHADSESLRAADGMDFLGYLYTLLDRTP